MDAELRKLVVNRKEKYLKIEAIVKKEEVEMDEITKRIRSIHAKLEQETNTLKQVIQHTKARQCNRMPIYFANFYQRLKSRKSGPKKKLFLIQKAWKPNLKKARLTKKTWNWILHISKADYRFLNSRYRIAPCNFRSIKKPNNA